MRGIDPKWTMYLGLLVAIEQAIGHGTVSLTNLVPADWAPYITSWCNFLAFVGTSIMTYQAAVSSPTAGPAINTPIAPTSTVVKILLVAFALSAFLATGSAQAQTPRLTGNIVRDIQTAKGGASEGSVLTGNPSKDLIALYGKLQAVSLVDLKYALNIANKKNNLAAGQCWTAIITQIEQDQTANLDANGQPLPTPDPHLFTDVERLSDVINSLGPNSPLMVGCGSFANQAKMNVLQLISTIMAGGAGIAALAP